MANGIKQQNNGFNSIYKGNFSIGINDISYGGTADTGFWNTIPATGSSTGAVIYTYITKGSDGPSIYEMSTNNFEFMTAINQIKTSVDGPYITTSTFTTTRNITIPSSSTASTYPLEFNVSGINSSINFATLTLGILSGSNVQNLGIVLVAPDNTTYALIKGSLSSPVATTGEISVNLSQYGGVFVPTFNSWDGTDSVKLNLEVPVVYANIHTGVADLMVTGHCNQLFAYAMGSGAFRMLDFKCKNVYANNISSSDQYFNVENKLEALVQYVGSTYYKGHPTEVIKNINQQGKLIQIE